MSEWLIAIEELLRFNPCAASTCHVLSAGSDVRPILKGQFVINIVPALVVVVWEKKLN